MKKPALIAVAMFITFKAFSVLYGYKQQNAAHGIHYNWLGQRVAAPEAAE